jgi:hypothetical protein
MFSGYPEAFAAPDKSTNTIIDLLLNEIYPRYGCPLQIIHDRGSEFTSSAFKEVLKELNIDNVSCTAYHPESNAKQERMHRVLHDILAKRVQGNTREWDIHLNMSLAGIRHNVSSSSKFSPFYLVYNRDPILPIDNLLRPRAKYHGEEYHKIALQEQHKSFLLAYKHLKHSKRKHKQQFDKKAKDIKFQINDPVYYKNFQRKNKLEDRWKSHYRIMEQKGPVTYLIKNQLDNSVVQVHADQIRLANITEWPERKPVTGYPKRKANYVVAPDDSSSSYDESDASDAERSNHNNSGLLPQSTNRVRQVREDSSSEDYIPLAQLRKHLREQNQEQNALNDSNTKNEAIHSDTNSDSEVSHGTNSSDENSSNDNSIMDFHSDHSAYLERKFQESSVDSQSQDSVDTDGMEIDSLPDTHETINQIVVMSEAVAPINIALIHSGPISSPQPVLNAETNSVPDKHLDNKDNDKQTCLQLLLGHMERSNSELLKNNANLMQNNANLMQGLIQKFF